MDIQLKGTNYEITPEVTMLAEKKIGTLKKYLGESTETVRAYVELGKAVGGQQSGDIWRAEINLAQGGNNFRAQATKATLENAIDKVVAEMGRELRRARGRNSDMVRKGGAAIKSLLRGFRQ